MKTLLISIPALLFAGSAFAQDVPADAAADAAAPAPAEAAPAAPAAPAAEVTPQEVDAFATAAIKLDAISKEAGLDDTAKQTAMVAAVQESGLEPQRFNEIGQQAQSDPALQEQVQLAVNRQVQSAAPGAQAGPANE